MKNSSFNLANTLGVAGLVIGILGVAGPIAWDFYKTRTELEVRVSGYTILIGNNIKLDGLSVQYKGEKLDQLAQATVSLTNIGRTPIVEKDVIQPITIAFTPDTKVVEVRVDSVTPSDLVAHIAFDRANGSATIAAPLLNPGDKINIGVIASSEHFDFSVAARIAGLSSVAVSKELLVAKPKRPISWTVYPVGVFSIFLALVSISLFKDWRKESAMKNAVREGRFEIPRLPNKAAVMTWIESQFSCAMPSERRALKTNIDALTDTPDFVEKNRDHILRAVQGLLGQWHRTLGRAWSLLFVEF